jgi:hypothetical protein
VRAIAAFDLPSAIRWNLANGDIRFATLNGHEPIARTWFTAHAWREIG